MVRFTPTCVGTIAPEPSPCSLNPVHPHVRGDNEGGEFFLTWLIGSPPRAWGQSIEGSEKVPAERFTPTCVGTIIVKPNGVIVLPVHPHVRGDNLDSQRISRPICGSPPRAWGQCQSVTFIVRMGRFTPTCVGTMSRGAAWRSIRAVHPHVRGDNFVRASSATCPDGSPPRAWGQLCNIDCLPAPERFTPTCVGTILPKSALLGDSYQKKTLEVFNPASGLTCRPYSKSLLLIRVMNHDATATP